MCHVTYFMQRDISQLSRGQYDVLAIGGGINGAAIAHMAALNGLKVALLEKGDFACGTSSKSTKLIHGGLRYLEHLEFGLVREALQERCLLLTDAPHLVKPLSFVIPVYKSDRRPLGLVRLGVWFYDFLSGKYLIQRHRSLSAQDILQLVPGIMAEGLAGGVMYYDAQMDDARLVLENVLSADEKGAHVANYVEVESFIKKDGKAVGVKAYDRIGGRHGEVYAKKIVCAVGPWTNVLMQKEEGLPAAPTAQVDNASSPVRTTKGVHVVCRGQISPHALLIPTHRDRRVFFVIPWMGNALIGTTDTDYKGSPDEVRVDDGDVDYLLDELRRVFPQAPFKKEDIITVFAGLRPLAQEKGAPSQVSRRHVIKKSCSGIVYVMGGKYTTYRRIAEDCLRMVLGRPPVDTRAGLPLYGSGVIAENAYDAAKIWNIDEKTAQFLMDMYGARYKDVLAWTEKEPSLKEPLCVCSKAIKAQAVYAVKVEMACSEEDIYKRRLSLVYRECKTGQCLKEIQKIIAGYR
ncbi:MAG: hypothetical protein A3G91_01450 [Omnitrophica WOR_2 bacterium RIFCSPLOWO2_12_FULL_50_9]|nr:MAG: hypothetical protein A3G91_01450 [Omnitrophica WOR_2 bacterium RIFCSPLOWO2_12_FULL_50_9]